MKYAVIKTGGKQYRVSEGEELLVEKLPGETDSAVKFPEVLLIKDEDQTVIGAPIIAGIAVEGKIVAQTKSKKVRIATYKAKSKYRKVKGHRQSLTRVKITRIVSEKSGKLPKPKAKPESTTKKQESKKPKAKK